MKKSELTMKLNGKGDRQMNGIEMLRGSAENIRRNSREKGTG